MPSIFTKIIHGEVPCYKIKEDDNFIAFLDVSPLVRGHVLVVPKKEIDNFFDVPDELLAQWLVFAKPIAKSIEKNFNCSRCGIEVIGLDVPHAHMHLIPINSANDLNFTRPKLQLPSEEMELVRQKIVSGL